MNKTHIIIVLVITVYGEGFKYLSKCNHFYKFIKSIENNSMHNFIHKFINNYFEDFCILWPHGDWGLGQLIAPYISPLHTGSGFLDDLTPR